MGEPVVLVKAFPDSAPDLASYLSEKHDETDNILLLSYIVGPLTREVGESVVAAGISRVLSVNSRKPAIPVLIEDRFHQDELCLLAKRLGLHVRRRTLTQKTYWADNINSTYTYTYYQASPWESDERLREGPYGRGIATQLQPRRVSSPERARQTSGVSRQSEMGTSGHRSRMRPMRKR